MDVLLGVGCEGFDTEGVVRFTLGVAEDFFSVANSLEALGATSFVRVVLLHGISEGGFKLRFFVSSWEMEKAEEGFLLQQSWLEQGQHSKGHRRYAADRDEDVAGDEEQQVEDYHSYNK